MMYYSNNNIVTLRNERLSKRHWLFIDLGAYRSTVLCWPDGKDLRDVAIVSKYLISHPGSSLPGFPSAFMKKELEFEFLTEHNMKEVPKDDYIDSAKLYFAKEYTAHKGVVEEFSHYMTQLLLAVFEALAKADSDSPWNYKEIPVIQGIKLTVPDLFIENLREGYRQTIHQICHELRDQDERWKLILPEQHISQDDFAQITSDENGTGELYFIHILQNLPFLDLSHQDDREINQEDVNHFFQTFPHPGKKDSSLNIVCCVIDVGGLTTDASISLLGISPSNSTHELEARLLMKNSFSEDRAGRYFQENFEEFRQTTRNHNCQNKDWWECEAFLNSNPATFLLRIIEDQYKVMEEWKENPGVDGLYFILAGRPTQAKAVQNLLLRLILGTFNKEQLSIMKEQCLFMSNYPHVWREGNLRRASINHELAKLVTVVGNLFTLQPAGYEVSEDIIRYYLKVETGKRHNEIFEMQTENQMDLQGYALFCNRLAKGNSNTLSFSKQREGKYEAFLTVSGKLKGQDPSLYPKLRIGTLDKDTNRWILPSIYVENLVDERAHQYFSLRWEQSDED